jgi:hypothetical protein
MRPRTVVLERAAVVEPSAGAGNILVRAFPYLARRWQLRQAVESLSEKPNFVLKDRRRPGLVGMIDEPRRRCGRAADLVVRGAMKRVERTTT